MSTESDDQIAALRLEIQQLRADLEAARAQGFPATPPPAALVPETVLAAPTPETFPRSPVETMSGENRTLLLIGGGLLLLLLLFLMATCSGSGTTAPSDPARAAAEAAAADADAAATAATAAAADAASAPAAPEPAPPAPGGQWSYDQSEEAMGGTTKTACVTSDDRISLDFPYSPAFMRLCVRHSPKYGLDVYALINGDGQILCNTYSRCHIRVRFDEKPAQSWSGADAADGSSNIVFLHRTQTLVGAIKSAKRMRIELEFYQAGSQSVSFNVEGLKWP